jgi:hypothetical protein
LSIISTFGEANDDLESPFFVDLSISRNNPRDNIISITHKLNELTQSETIKCSKEEKKHSKDAVAILGKVEKYHHFKINFNNNNNNNNTDTDTLNTDSNLRK